MKKKLASKAAEERRERKTKGSCGRAKETKKRTEQGKTDDEKDVRPALVTESNKNKNMYVQG